MQPPKSRIKVKFLLNLGFCLPLDEASLILISL